MDPITMGLLLGGGAGLVKGGILDRDKEARQRKQEAEIARYSPWSGMQAQRPQQADPLGSAMQGAMAGGMMGQSFGGGAAEAGAASGGAALQGQSVDPTMQPGYMPKSQFDQQLALKYPWLNM